jgi:hypothetical protein
MKIRSAKFTEIPSIENFQDEADMIIKVDL